jgi:hypothetical protein
MTTADSDSPRVELAEAVSISEESGRQLVLFWVTLGVPLELRWALSASWIALTPAVYEKWIAGLNDPGYKEVVEFRLRAPV